MLRSQLYGYQRDKMIPRMVAGKRVGAFVRMGLGKTVSTLTALADLGMPKTLVLAPARVVEMDVWGEEARRWDHLKGLHVHPLNDGPEERRKYLLFPGRADVEVVSYELFPWLAEEVDLEKRYGAIVFDELSKMKTPGAKRFKRMRTRSMEIPIRFGLTGSPKPNHLLDLWGEMFAIAGEEPLGPHFTSFRARYFTPIDTGGPRGSEIWSPVFEAQEMITERLKPWAFSLDPGDAPPLPPVKLNGIDVPLPARVRKMAEELAKELRTNLASGHELLALSSSTRAAKLRQMVGGAVYTDPLGTVWEEVHDEKIKALQEIVDEQQGEPLLVFYWYRHELERILKAIPQAEAVTPESLKRWNEGKVEVLIAHPASVGHGLNLQFGGSTIAWYTLPWSWELFSQANARLARHGQAAPFVMAHLILAGAVDLAVLSSLKEKERTESELVKAVQI